jgi:hypothetical protein
VSRTRATKDPGAQFIKACKLVINSTKKRFKTEVGRWTTSACAIARDKAPKASLNLVSSIGTKFSNGGFTGTVFVGATYAPFPEGQFYGATPGCKARGPGGWPPKEPILRWMKFKGIPEEALYAIRRKIGTVGTTATPFMKPAFDATEQPFIDAINEAAKRAVKEIESARTQLDLVVGT